MTRSEQYDAIVAAVEQATGHHLKEKERPTGEGRELYRFHKLILGQSEFAMEFDGLSIHAFTEDFSTGAKDSRTLGHDGADGAAIAAFLAGGIAEAIPRHGPR